MRDSFAKTAISFILGVLLGFTLLLFGVVFLMVGLVVNNASTALLEDWMWYLMAVASTSIGILLMYLNLRNVPVENQYK